MPQTPISCRGVVRMTHQQRPPASDRAPRDRTQPEYGLPNRQAQARQRAQQRARQSGEFPYEQPAKTRPRREHHTDDEGNGKLIGGAIFLLILGLGNYILYAYTGWLIIPIPRR